MPLNKFFDKLEKSYWFIPFIFCMFPFLVLYLVFIFAIGPDNVIHSQPFFLNIVQDHESAKVVLKIIAATVISMATISFSITILVLSISSQQYTPRLIQSFMHHNDTKLILGIFLASFIYCILSIGMIEDNPLFIPVFTMVSFIGLMFGVLSLFAFVYFINYVINTISLPNILQSIEEEIEITLKKYQQASNEPENINIKLYDSSCKYIMFAKESGYLKLINYKNLFNEIGEDIYLKILYKPGDYIVENTPLLEVHFNKGEISNKLKNNILNEFIMGNERDSIQDILYPLTQIVEIAVRALSPGVNDPNTAINCIHVLSKNIAKISNKNIFITTDNLEISKRIEIPQITYIILLKQTLRIIFDNAKDNRIVLFYLMTTISNLMKISSFDKLNEALIALANLILSYNTLNEFDKNELLEEFKHLNISGDLLHAK